MLDLMSILGSQKGELRYDLETGYAYGSKSLTARLAGVECSTLTSQLKKGVVKANKIHTFLTAKGFDGVLLVGDAFRHDVMHRKANFATTWKQVMRFARLNLRQSSSGYANQSSGGVFIAGRVLEEGYHTEKGIRHDAVKAIVTEKT
jgi:stalled ribosome alternative rescue factor ArfA